MTCVDAQRRIDAYIDGELSVEDAAAVGEHVGACAVCGPAVTRRLALARVLRAMPREAASDRLRAAVATAVRRRRIVRLTAWAAAAAFVMSIAGAGAARVVSTRRATDAIAVALVTDHVDALRAQHLVDVVSSDQHTVKPWFLGKLDFSPPVVDLAPAGFPLAGARADHVNGRTIAVLIYHRRLHPIAVFVWPESDLRESASDVRTIRGFHVMHWTRQGMAFWVVSDLDVDECQEFVHLLGR